MDIGGFDPTWIFLSLIPGGIGFVLFVYGKKQQRWPHLVAGLAMMVPRISRPPSPRWARRRLDLRRVVVNRANRLLNRFDAQQRSLILFRNEVRRPSGPCLMSRTR
jgi:hypothetical protein